jgi:hypothetical protein
MVSVDFNDDKDELIIVPTYRICPGRHLGSSIVWLASLCILTTCEILKAKDEHGNTIEPGMELDSSITAYVITAQIQVDEMSG